MNGKRMLALFGVVALILAACGPATRATPTAMRATATATPLPVGTTPQPTPTPKPTPTPTKAAPSGPKYGGTLRYFLRQDPAFWDVQLNTAGARDSRVPFNTAFNLLANMESETPALCVRKFTPELAESWRWVDDRIMEVKIHQGVKFHNKAPANGREMTAEDVVFSYNRGIFIYPTRGIMVAADPLDKIEAVDRYTVRFINKRPNPSLPQVAFASKYGLGIFPKEIGDPKEKWEDLKYWVGTGPFAFKSWVTSVKLVFEKHPNYWMKGLPYLDAVEMLVMPDQSLREAALRSGQLDIWNRELQAPTAEALKKTAPQLTIVECPGVGTYGVLYLRGDRPPFNDVRVRRAFAMSVDRDTIVNTILQGHARVTGPLPPTNPWYSKREDLPPEVRKYLEYHPDQAKQLLVQAGYPDGLSFTLSTAPRMGTYYMATIEAIVDMAKPAGFKVKPLSRDYSAYVATTVQGKWADNEDATIMPGTREIPWIDALAFHSKSPGSENKGHFSDPEYDKLAEAFLAAPGEAKQRELFKQLEIYMANQAYWVWVAAAMEMSAHQPWVKNYAFSGEDYYGAAVFGRIWIDK